MASLQFARSSLCEESSPLTGSYLFQGAAGSNSQESTAAFSQCNQCILQTAANALAENFNEGACTLQEKDCDLLTFDLCLQIFHQQA